MLVWAIYGERRRRRREGRRREGAGINVFIMLNIANTEKSNVEK